LPQVTLTILLSGLTDITNGTVSDNPLRLLHHQRAQAHISTLYRRQHSFMYCLCSKQNCLLCAYECDLMTMIS
jgi:hypothetical protein